MRDVIETVLFCVGIAGAAYFVLHYIGVTFHGSHHKEINK